MTTEEFCEAGQEIILYSRLPGSESMSNAVVLSKDRNTPWMVYGGRNDWYWENDLQVALTRALELTIKVGLASRWASLWRSLWGSK